MMNDALKEEDWSPKRDQRGRFKKGASGNPNGRPPKRPEEPWTYQKSFSEALAECVSVTGLDGTSQPMALRDLLIKTLVRGAVKAKPRDLLAIVQQLAKLDVLVPTAEEQEPEKDIFTEEHRFLMERLKRDFPVLCQSEKPVYGDSEQGPTRDDFRFE